MASAIASSPTRVCQGLHRESYGKLRYLHKSSEKVFIAWVTSRSKFLQNLNGHIYLKTPEREFYCIEECVPPNMIDELIAIVDARAMAKVVHVANGTHDGGHENCLQMYKYFLRRANKQIVNSPPPPSIPPEPASDDDFPPITSSCPTSPTRRVSTKRPFSTIHPVSAPTSPSATNLAKKPRLVLKPRSAWAGASAIAVC